MYTNETKTSFDEFFSEKTSGKPHFLKTDTTMKYRITDEGRDEYKTLNKVLSDLENSFGICDLDANKLFELANGGRNVPNSSVQKSIQLMVIMEHITEREYINTEELSQSDIDINLPDMIGENWVELESNDDIFTLLIGHLEYLNYTRESRTTRMMIFWEICQILMNDNIFKKSLIGYIGDKYPQFSESDLSIKVIDILSMEFLSKFNELNLWN